MKEAERITLVAFESDDQGCELHWCDRECETLQGWYPTCEDALLAVKQLIALGLAK